MREQGAGSRFAGRLFEGLDIHARVIRARAGVREDTTVVIRTTVCHHG